MTLPLIVDRKEEKMPWRTVYHLISDKLAFALEPVVCMIYRMNARIKRIGVQNVLKCHVDFKTNGSLNKIALKKINNQLLSRIQLHEPIGQ